METKTRAPKALRPLDLLYHPIFQAEYHTAAAFRAELRLNDPSLGVILPEQYLPVALRDARGVKLAKAALDLILSDMESFEKRGVFFEFLSVALPVRYLFRDNLCDELPELFSAHPGVDPESLCLTFPEQLLYEDETRVKPLFDSLHETGVKIALSGFGTPLSPALRLPDFSLDLLFLHPYFSNSVLSNGEEAPLLYLLEMITSLGILPVASGIDNADEADTLASRNCLYSEGALAGKPHRAAGIRA